MLGACSPKQQENRVGYFTNLTGIISPYLDYIPRGEVTSEQAKELPHYKVQYFDDGTIQQLAYYYGAAPSDDAYYGVHRVNMNYNNNQLVRTYFDKNGNKGSLWRHYYLGDNIHEEVFELDGEGNKRSLVLLDSSGVQVETGLGSYSFSFETLRGNSFIQRQFDREGIPNYLTSYFPFEATLITKDSLNRLYSIENIDPDSGELVNHPHAGFAKVIFDFDQYGNEMGWRFYDASGNLANRLAFENMDYGYSQWLYTFDWRDRSLGLFDAFTEKYYDSDSMPVDNSSGIHEVRYVRNKMGKTTHYSYYNKNGENVLHPQLGYAGMEIQYNDDGLRIGAHKMDMEGKRID